MYNLVHCSSCRFPLQFPPGTSSMRCGICRTVTFIADQRYALPPPPSSSIPMRMSVNSSRAPPQPSGRGRKKAVIIGITYRNTKHELKGCLNDAIRMFHLLINQFHFSPDSILMLTEKETNPYRIPTRKNILMALNWLVKGCKPGDSLVFHYSGHGSSQKNYNGDEVDGYDETICPLDVETKGEIVDDEINETIVRPLPPGVRLHAIIDACHSGTMLDLPFLCKMHSLHCHLGNKSGLYRWEDHRPRSGVWKGTSGGEAFSFSGCDDHEESAETSALSKGIPTGVMTSAFIQAIEHGEKGTYGHILKSMRETIRNTGDGDGGWLRQKPQLSANERFDVHTRPFYL